MMTAGNSCVASVASTIARRPRNWWVLRANAAADPSIRFTTSVTAVMIVLFRK